jgi:hypothetical protein
MTTLRCGSLALDHVSEANVSTGAASLPRGSAANRRLLFEEVSEEDQSGTRTRSDQISGTAAAQATPAATMVSVMTLLVDGVCGSVHPDTAPHPVLL